MTQVFSADALAGQVVFVTGASRGIGAGILEACLKAGAVVIGTATSESGAERITQKIAQLGGKGEGVVLNVTDAEQSEKVLADAAAKFGGISVLVNNAGITRDGLAMRMKDEQWQEVIDTNLTPAFRLSRIVMRSMMKARFGRIINIVSVVGSMGNAGQANYAAAKAGVAGLTRALARELASRNITVNAVAPGFIETDMTRELPEDHQAALKAQIPLGRLGQTDDIAASVVFLASPAASYITGVTLHVNGGMYMV
jgi:3-oxoacyl-[acyl-carrier protein] reductase